jgi:hypothetical protein
MSGALASAARASDVNLAAEPAPWKHRFAGTSGVVKFSRQFSGHFQLRSVGADPSLARPINPRQGANIMLRRSVLQCLAMTGLVLVTGFGSARPESSSEQATAVMVAEFSYLDTSGEPSDQSDVHRARLQAFMVALRRDIAADRHLRLVGTSCAPSCAAEEPSTNALLRAASEAGAKVLIIGGVHKLSTLVQWARAAAIDVASNRLLFEKLFTFRGDNDEAWQQAEAFVSRDIRRALATAPTQIRLAIFPFELEDTSAGAGVIGATESDIKGLTDATDAVRQLLEQSGRYRLIAAGPPADAQALHDCGGCDARLALQLGADQSLVGVVRRIGRTEYTVRFQVRDSGTGAVITAADSGLRMGANYSWGRGAVRLVQDRLLDDAAPKP